MLIKSTVRGYLGNIANCFTVSAILLTIAWYLSSYINGQLAEADLNSIWEVRDILDFDTPFPYFAYALMWLLYIFIALHVVEIFHNIFYDARETNELQADGNNWSKISARQYSFPAARETSTAVINRVTKVTVSESTIDRILGTGTLQLKLTVFLNATEAQMYWKIPAIEDPHGVADSIRSKSLSHDGTRTITTLVPRGEMPA